MHVPRTARLGAFLLAVIGLAGCAATHESGSASAAGCTMIAARAVHDNAVLATVPRPCRGLGPFELNHVVKIAVSGAASHGTKSWRRHLAIEAYSRLSVLTTAADHEAAAQRAARARRLASRPPATPAQAAPRLRIPAGLSALAAWLLTAASGGTLILRRLTRRPRRGLPPVLLAHLGFALAGLAVWVAYLVTGVVATAWAALGVLLPVAGLGMASLLLAIPDPKPGASGPPGPGRWTSAPTPSGALGAGGAAGHPAAVGAATATVAPAATTAGAGGSSRRPRPPVLLIAAHGALATLTILLALLGTIAAVAAH